MTSPLTGGPSIVPPQAPALAAAPQSASSPAAAPAAGPSSPAMAQDSSAMSAGNGTASQLAGATELWANAVLTEKFDHLGLPPDVPKTGVWSDAIELAAQEYKPTIGEVTLGAPSRSLPDRPTWRELTLAVEDALGVGKYRTDHRGHKRDVLLNDNRSAFDTQAWGPQTTKFMRQAYEAIQRGDLEAARRCYEQGRSAVSPIMLDLNGDGKLGTTGVSTAKERIDDQVGRTVSFDIDGDGIKDEIEWMSGDGDGMLVDDRDGGATGAMLTDGEIDGKRLFGDQGGKYANGYEKLKALDKDGDGKISGAELDGLKVWIDDGDAKLEKGELKTLRELGITEISVVMKLEANARGEDLMRSSFVQNGQSKVTEDVWFASK
ncbi:hypothetical protein D3C87_505340 [compost metagenome]